MTDCACAANGLSCMVALSLALVVVVGFAAWSSIADSMFWLFAVVHVVSVVFGAGLLRAAALHVALNMLEMIYFILHGVGGWWPSKVSVKGLSYRP